MSRPRERTSFPGPAIVDLLRRIRVLRVAAVLRTEGFLEVDRARPRVIEQSSLYVMSYPDT